MTVGGSSASDQISLEMGSPPSAFGSFPREETFAKLMVPLSPPCGGRCHGVTEGGSAASNQIGLEMGSPPSAFGISPARGAKGTYSKVSARGEAGIKVVQSDPRNPLKSSDLRIPKRRHA